VSRSIMHGSILFVEMKTWLSRKQYLFVAMLLLLFLASSIGVIYSAHMTRQMYSSLQSLQQEQDDLDNRYEKLLLEQSAWADYTRVDQLAREELNMIAPLGEELVIVGDEVAFNSEGRQ
jgi:cell division protein FtsL